MKGGRRGRQQDMRGTGEEEQPWAGTSRPELIATGAEALGEGFVSNWGHLTQEPSILTKQK